MKARNRTLFRCDAYRQQFRGVSTFLDCHQRHRSTVRWIFQWKYFWRIANLSIPSLHLFFFLSKRIGGTCKRQCRGTRYDLAEEVGSRNRRKEAAFSENFPVAPCANIYRGVSGSAQAATRTYTRAIAMQHLHTRIHTHEHACPCPLRAITHYAEGRSMHRGVV